MTHSRRAFGWVPISTYSAIVIGGISNGIREQDKREDARRPILEYDVTNLTCNTHTHTHTHIQLRNELVLDCTGTWSN
jgi:hypothetical protein